jgi:hypothetical protein
MFPEPRLGETQAVGGNQLLDVSIVTVCYRPVRRMQGHHEQTELHGDYPFEVWPLTCGLILPGAIKAAGGTKVEC